MTASRREKRTGRNPSKPCSSTHSFVPVDISEERRNPGYAVPEVDPNVFLHRLLPPLKKRISIEDIVSSLQCKGLVGVMGRWKGFGVTHRRRTKRSRKAAFAPLVDIFEKVTSMASANVPNLTRTLDMAMVPMRRRKSGRKLTLPSGYFLLRDRNDDNVVGDEAKGKPPSWFDVALISEFGQSDVDGRCEDIGAKTICNVQRILSRDPRRRFAFGISVQDRSMRLWLGTHGTPIVSEAFDFTKEIHLLTHVFLSLAFASKEELGWDPTIRDVTLDDGNRAYHIDVGDETYETVQVLADNADILDSPATRVWKVKQSNSDSEESYVLKDVWIDDGEPLEHGIYEEMMSDIEKKYGPDIRNEVASHLLTPVAHCLVPMEGEEDHTTKVIMRGCSPSFKQFIKVKVNKPIHSDDEGSEVPSSTHIRLEHSQRGTLKSPLPWYNPTRRVHHRRHYRIVFKEMAQPLIRVRNLGDVFLVLSDCAKVLKWIHGSGWVHRDLSINNLYLFEGRGLIGDLEYAKRTNSDVEWERMAGTPEFMAVEASDRKYIYTSPPSRQKRRAQIQAFKEGKVEEAMLIEKTWRPPRFFHNDLHDLESLWWIAIWVLFSFKADPDTAVVDLSPERDFGRTRAITELFPRNSETEDRISFLAWDDAFYSHVASIPDYPDSIRDFLDTLRNLLVDKAIAFETEFSKVRMDIFEGTHDEFRTLLGRCQEHGRNIKLVPFVGGDRRAEPSRTGNASQAIQATEQPGPVEKPESNPSPLPLKEIVNLHENSEVHSLSKFPVRKGKRKRDDNDDSLADMRPPQIPRIHPEVCRKLRRSKTVTSTQRL